MNLFPLTPFLDKIKDDIPLCVKDYERMILVLQGRGPWSMERLKDSLLALLVKNPDQQEKFLRRFDAFFPAGAETVLDDHEVARVMENIRALIREPEVEEDTKPESDQTGDNSQGNGDDIPVNPMRRVWVWIILLVVLVGIGAAGFWKWKEEPVQPVLPVLVCEPGQLDFGRVEPGKSAPLTVGLVNKGPGPVQITGIMVTGNHGEDYQHEGLSFPVLLAENERREVSAAFSPRSGGLRTALLQVESTAANSPQFVVLKGYLKQEGAALNDRKRLYKNAPVVETLEYYPLPEKTLGWLVYVCLAVLFLAGAVRYGLYLRRTRRIPDDEEARWDPNGPRHFSRAVIGGDRPPILRDDLLDHLADCMGYFQSERTGKVVDVPASVRAAVDAGGIPVIMFEKRRQTRALLILEDRFAAAAEWNPIAKELAAGMDRRGVPVIHGWYDRSPGKFKTPDGSGHHLEDYEDGRDGYLTLMFSDGRGFDRTDTLFALERLARWPMKAWMDYETGRLDEESAAKLRSLDIPVFPASADGLGQAAGRFLTEQGLSRNLPEKSLEPPLAVLSERLDAQVEFLLGDALVWAQDCAMTRPISLGLADALRRQFHPLLPPDRLARLFSLPGTQNTASGLRFSNEVEIVLRAGFKETRSDPEQKQVMRFILDEIQKVRPPVEPGKDPGLDYLKWETALERTRMELDPNYDMERLAALARTDLGPSMIADLEQYDFNGREGKIPLRVKPENPKALQRLASLGKKEENPFGIPRLKAFPLKPAQWGALTALILCVLGFSGMGLHGGIEYFKPVQNCQISGFTGEQLSLECKQDREWGLEKKWRAGDAKPLLFSQGLPHDGECRLTAYDNGHKTSHEFTLKPEQGVRIAFNRKDQPHDCRAEYPETGLTTLRCPEWKEPPGDAFGDAAVPVKTWKEILAGNAPGNRVMSIGLEFADEPETSPSLPVLREALLETGSVDILYQARTGIDGKWHVEEIFKAIREDLDPWIKTSQLVWWGSGNFPKSEVEKNILEFERIAVIDVKDGAGWTDALAQVFKSGQHLMVSESDLLASLGGRASGTGAPAALIRDRGGIPPISPEITNSLGMKFVYIEPGTFEMGSAESPEEMQKKFGGDIDWYKSEKPQHKVNISNGFYMQTTEVKTGQWKKFVEETGYKGDGNDVWRCNGMGRPEEYSQEDDHPVACISWNEIQAFIKWLNQKGEGEYRLPAESEWEYAARAGSKTAFANGEITEMECGLDPNLDKMGWYCGNAGDKTHPAGGKQPNVWGLYDMHGNVWEWTEDDWHDNYENVPDDGSDWVDNPRGSDRVVRGGSWGNNARNCRSANRGRNAPGGRYGRLGARLARSLP
jgi:formylglycine-generating enzyme required for sulfatase activity